MKKYLYGMMLFLLSACDVALPEAPVRNHPYDPARRYPNFVFPDVPTNGTFTRQGNEVTVSWTPGANAELTLVSFMISGNPTPINYYVTGTTSRYTPSFNLTRATQVVIQHENKGYANPTKLVINIPAP
jgi:hypothetical protein